MDLQVSSPSALSGIFSPPGDKSISHRAVLLGALAEGQSVFENFLESGVTQVMIQCLETMGIIFQLEDDRLTVHGQGITQIRPPGKPLNCGHSGTTLRLLTGALTAANLPVTLDGSASLRRRPMSRVVAPLRLMGANIQSHHGKAPIVLHQRKASRPLKGITYPCPIPSAQVKSAILLAGLAAETPTIIIEKGPSRDHTENMLRLMGADLKTKQTNNCFSTQITPQPGQSLSPIRFHIPGDISSAAFIITAALLVPGSIIRLQNVGLNWTRTGFLEALIQMGADVILHPSDKRTLEKSGDIEIHYDHLRNITVEGDLVIRMIDEFPAFALLAAFSEGTCLVKNARELRHKESDRIRGICQGLSKLGIQIEERQDGFRIMGKPDDLPGEVVLHPGHDHRMAMTFVLAGLRTRKPILVKNAEIISQSFPGFIGALEALGANSLKVFHD